jgi:hypothetical protein
MRDLTMVRKGNYENNNLTANAVLPDLRQANASHLRSTQLQPCIAFFPHVRHQRTLAAYLDLRWLVGWQHRARMHNLWRRHARGNGGTFGSGPKVAGVSRTRKTEAAVEKH